MSDLPQDVPQPDPPLKVALIGGTGLGETFRSDNARIHEPDTPFGRPSSPILEAQLEGVAVLLLSRHGLGHVIPPGQVPYRANIFALKALGATHVLASGAVGSLREEYRPRHLVIPDQTIDKTAGRPQSFYEGAAVHVDFSQPFCPVLRRLLLDAAADGFEAKAHDGGCYICMEGPAFSTRAESHMHRLWGGDLIGMTLLPEAKLAREAELPYAAVCLVTDYDSWRAPAPANEAATPAAIQSEIIENLRQVTASAGSLIRRAVGLMGQRRSELAECPAADALALGIWSDRRQINPAEVRRLWPLWGRHFQADITQDSPAAAAPSAVD